MRHDPSNHERRIVGLLAAVAIMTVVFGLWLLLLPGQLQLNGRHLKPSGLWSQIRSSGQEAVSDWQVASQAVGLSLKKTAEDAKGEIGAAADQSSYADGSAAAIASFRNKLEQTAIQNAETTRP